jgi:hypothetical protein
MDNESLANKIGLLVRKLTVLVQSFTDTDKCWNNNFLIEGEEGYSVET